MKSQLNIEVTTGNLKLSQAKSQLGKSKLQRLFNQGPKGGRDQSLRSRPKETLNITKPCRDLILRS